MLALRVTSLIALMMLPLVVIKWVFKAGALYLIDYRRKRTNLIQTFLFPFLIDYISWVAIFGIIAFFSPQPTSTPHVSGMVLWLPFVITYGGGALALIAYFCTGIGLLICHNYADLKRREGGALANIMKVASREIKDEMFRIKYLKLLLNNLDEFPDGWQAALTDFGAASRRLNRLTGELLRSVGRPDPPLLNLSLEELRQLRPIARTEVEELLKREAWWRESIHALEGEGREDLPRRLSTLIPLPESLRAEIERMLALVNRIDARIGEMERRAKQRQFELPFPEPARV